MADSYLEFSEMLTDLSTEEAKWLKHQLEVIHVIDGKEYPEDDLPDSGDTGETTWIGCRAYRDMDDYDDDYGEVGFEYELKDDNEGGKRYLWIYSQDNASLDNVAYLVQKFLRKFRPDETWSLTYSVTCSKPRLSEFGGGAIFVTASEVKWFNAWDFVEEQKNKSKLHIVVEISGGLVQDVYCSDPQADFITIDWDTEGCDLNDPRVVEVGQQAAYITQPEVYPLDKLAGTDTETALNNWRN